MAAMTPEQARSYFRRFEELREVELQELRRTSMETKLRQLGAMMASRHLFAADPNRESEVQAVRERWALLRRSVSDR